MLGDGLSYLICVHVCEYVQGKVTHQSNAVRPAHAHSRAQKVRGDETIAGVSVCWRETNILICL